MITRLGDVLFWLGCLLAVACLAIGLYGFASSRSEAWGVLGSWVLIAVAFWLIGRACRYVLAGR